MTSIEEAITEWFGPRCPDHEPGCPCCDAWAEYDSMKAEIEGLREAMRVVASRADDEIERLRAEVKQARVGALREAAALECDANFERVWTGYECGVSDMQEAIRALIDKEAGE